MTDTPVTTPPITPRRSALYMPGSNARALEKAKTLPADVVILDLEDAVAPDAKTTARAQIEASVLAGGYGSREIVVRINGLSTPWGEADLDMAAELFADGRDGVVRNGVVLLPKVAGPAIIEEVAARLADMDSTARIWAMIETPAALINLPAIAGAARDPFNRLDCFVMGTNDLAKDTRARLVPGRAAMLPWLMQALVAARAAGIDILDGVYNDLSDQAGFEVECAQGRDCGFDGKTLIHPGQIEAANRAFAPSPDEIQASAAIVAAFEQPENAGLGAIALDGRMVERLHATMAARIIALDQAIRDRTT